jgi:hypothetical protein
VSDPPHNAETVADTGPRWGQTDTVVDFLTRAGPIDLWLDSTDRMQPFLVVYIAPKNVPRAFWARDAAHIIEQTKAKRVHLTLHDECIIHQLCAPHNNPNPNGD